MTEPRGGTPCRAGFVSSPLGGCSGEPGFALVYVNGRYAGTAQQFTKPFRPLRVGLGPQRIEFRAPVSRRVLLGEWQHGKDDDGELYKR